MNEQQCPNCGMLFKTGDKIKAVVLADYIAIRSKRVFAIEKPYDCLDMVHQNCQHPTTGGQEGD